MARPHDIASVDAFDFQHEMHMSNASFQEGFTSSAVTVPTTGSIAISGTTMSDRRLMVLFNEGSNNIYLGGANVDATNSGPIMPGANAVLPVNTHSAVQIYARATMSNGDLRILEMK